MSERFTKIEKYNLSRDYEVLYELVKTTSIVCVVDYHNCRDVASTNYKPEFDDLDIGVRGMCYYNHGKHERFEEFEDWCESVNLEFIEPMED